MEAGQMSTYTYSVRPNTTTATQVISAGDGPHLIWNRDLVNSVWIADTNSVRLNDPELVEIQPNGSISVDGESDKFAISSSPVNVATIMGGMSNFRGLTVANGSLVLPSIHSPGYIPGSAGWSINSDNSAEFNDLVLRGTFFGTDYVISPNGEFYYDGTPATGNLSASSVPGSVNVSDGHGNVALPGHSVYQTPIALNTIAFSLQQGIIIWYTWNGSNWGIGPSIDWTLANGFIEFLGAALRSFAGTRSNPTIISTDSVTNFGAFGPNFGAGGPAPWQTLMPTGAGNTGTVRLGGQVLTTAATAANATMVSLLANPARQQDFITPNNISGYVAPARVVRVDTSGNVRLLPAAGAAGQFVMLDGIDVLLG